MSKQSKPKARRKWTPEQKDAAVRDLDSGMSSEEVCRKHGMSDSVLYTWRKKRREGATAVVVATAGTASAAAAETQRAMRDALLFLRKGKAELLAGLRTGRITDLDQTHLLSLLALRSLQGE